MQQEQAGHIPECNPSENIPQPDQGTGDRKLGCLLHAPDLPQYLFFTLFDYFLPFFIVLIEVTWLWLHCKLKPLSKYVCMENVVVWH